MRLAELFPEFVRLDIRRETGSFVRPGVDPLRKDLRDEDFESREHDALYYVPVKALAEADGIWFTNPTWALKNPGQDGCEFGASIQINFKDRQKMPAEYGSYAYWAVSGSGYEDLTITPSILCRTGIGNIDWHGFITRGEIITV